jgi:putative transposase
MADDRLNDRARAPARGRGTDCKRGADAQGLGRSRGGLSTKIHAATDALGNPVRLLFGPGQRNDITRAHELIDGFEPEAIIADKGYDADHLREAVLAGQAKPVIPPKSNRRTPIDYDKALYKERNLVERFFNKLKQFRRVATRYDKLLVNYRGFVILAAVAILLR